MKSIAMASVVALFLTGVAWASAGAFKNSVRLKPILASGDPNPDGGAFQVGDGGFYPFWQFDADDQRVVFIQHEERKFGGSGRPEAVYLVDQGSNQRMVDRSTLVPGGSGTFTDFSAPLLFRGGVVFQGRDSAGSYGLYLATSSGVQALVDGPAFGSDLDERGFPILQVDGSRLVFLNDAQLFLYESGVLTRLVGVGDQLPDGVSTYSRIFRADVSQQLVAFTAETSAGWGVFVWSNGRVTTIANRGALPSGIAAAPRGLSVDAGRVAFTLVSRDDFAAAYLWSEDGLRRLLSRSDHDPLTGRSLRHVADIYLSPESVWVWALTAPECARFLFFCAGPAVFDPSLFGTLYSIEGEHLVPLVSFGQRLDGSTVDQFHPRLADSRGVVLVGPDDRRNGGTLYEIDTASIVAPVPAQSDIALAIFAALLAVSSVRWLRGVAP